MMSKLRNNILYFHISRYYQLHHQKQIYAKKNMSRLFYDYIKVRISHKLNNYRVKHPLEETTYGTYTILSSTSRNIFPSYSCVPSACIIFITTLNQDLRGCVKVREHYNTIPETINSKQEITRCSRSDYLNVICNSLQITIFLRISLFFKIAVIST